MASTKRTTQEIVEVGVEFPHQMLVTQELVTVGVELAHQMQVTQILVIVAVALAPPRSDSVVVQCV
jgi:hypothetical protein